MKFNFKFLLFCVLLSVSCGLLISYTLGVTRSRARQELEASPFLIYSFSDDVLHGVVKVADSLKFTKKYNLQQGRDVADTLAKKYDLTEVLTLLGNDVLPSVLVIYPQALNYDKRMVFLEKLKKYRQQITYEYDENLWETFESKEKKYLQFELYFLLAYGFILFLASSLGQMFTEWKTDGNWRIFRNAGGNYHKRWQHFWKRGMVGLVFSCALAAGGSYLIESRCDYPFVIVTALAVLLAQITFPIFKKVLM